MSAEDDVWYIADNSYWTKKRAKDGFWYPPQKGFMGGGLKEGLYVWTYSIASLSFFIGTLLAPLGVAIGGVALGVWYALPLMLGQDAFQLWGAFAHRIAAHGLITLLCVLGATLVAFVAMCGTGLEMQDAIEKNADRQSVPPGRIEVVGHSPLGQASLRWTDEIPTGVTVADHWDTYARQAKWLPPVAIAIGAGLYGGPVLAIVGGIIGFYFGSRLRQLVTAVRPRNRRTQGAVDETKPDTSKVTCYALVFPSGGELHFVIQRFSHAHNRDGYQDRDMTSCPLDSFVNFQDGAYSPWFRAATSPSAVQNDYAVVVQPRGKPRILISRHVDPDFTNRLRGELEQAYVVGREAVLLRWKEMMQGKGSSGAEDGSIPKSL